MTPIGAHYNHIDNTCTFCVWAPLKETMILELVHPVKQKVEMAKDELGYFTATVKNTEPGTQYFYLPDGTKRIPDPASFYQPQGVHGPSEVIGHNYNWNDAAWKGLPFNDLILYELHVGTFTNEGSFDAVIQKLDDLIAIGVNAIEIMPVAQFPGKRNWGYDGVYPFAVQNSYGGPAGLKHLVDACHAKGIAVFLDVVYNHLGPEGNYFSEFGPYFSDTYRTPWGNAINYDGEWSDGVRDYFSSNMLYWFEYFHMDGIRADAIHAIYDSGAVHFWELAYNRKKDREQRLGKHFYMIAESDFNSPRVIAPTEAQGYGFTAQWLDDFHHAFYVLLDKDGKGFYEDFGRMEQLAKAYKDGYVHTGEYVKFRRRKYGTSSAGIPGNKFVVFNQNHDQIGNRYDGARLSRIVGPELLKIAAAALLLSPYIPLLFMGEEYGEDAPFYYFIDHSDKALIKAVQEGRKKEFEKFHWPTSPPDPYDEETFIESKLSWDKRNSGDHKILLQWYKELIGLRKHAAVLKNFNKSDIFPNAVSDQVFVLQRQDESGAAKLIAIFNLSDTVFEYTLPGYCPTWNKLLDSKDGKWLMQEENKPAEELPNKVNPGKSIAIAGKSVVIYTGSEHCK
jgi:maltooligosyltrehalose trehalohydrolase